MNSVLSLDVSLLYVHISNWEYQCCGAVPRVGGAVRGSLTLHPSRRPGYPAPAVLDWDPSSGLVRVGDLYAQLGFSVTDPYRTDLIVSLGWHDAGPAPTVLGTVEVLLEETGTYVRERTGELDIDPGTVDYREVREATMWPEDRREVGGPAAAGVVAGVRLAGIGDAADRAEVLAEGLRLFTETPA
ncbi:DUF6578 domain-containing protein [Tsukamurella paurometabola]|uniref:Uncharacterized protein n=1 Tax=Tsukamurella paurometabola TaxID=2061 RepID=A0A3P8L6C6_TSUPA|nr:DUF6578 domain-containing protein [Tsukamurella paurometabola]MBS4102613.1 hypothetical protein [Tsukamurella paurometabola]VDR38671.1 Uncharacterised protein [Tsukamurella paurometabola]